MTRLALAMITLSLLNACSFVDTIPGAELVILSNDLASCEKVGQTTVKVLDNIIGIDRSETAISEELQMLAQNSAIKMNANAIWPVTEITEGSRTYHILRCQPNN